MTLILYKFFQKINVYPRVYFVEMLKFISVTQFFKPGSPSIVSNCRPISIQLHNIAKMFESLVLNGIQRLVNIILMEKQHGFRPDRSTKLAILCLTLLCLSHFSSGRKLTLFIQTSIKFLT